jgi:hypothetical protein
MTPLFSNSRLDQFSPRDKFIQDIFCEHQDAPEESGIRL